MQHRDMVVENIEGTLISLDTVDPEADRSDLRPLKSLFENRTVIGLGESTHGTREFFRVKHRLIRFLVTELDIRVFGLETGFAGTLVINDYVLRGQGEPEEVLDGLGWHARTQEVLRLIEWLREFNKDRPRAEQVKFYGIDEGSGRESIKAVKDYLQRIDPVFYDEHQEKLAELESFRDWGEDVREERLNTAKDTHSVLEDQLIEFEAEYIAKSSRDAWRLAKHHLDIFDQAREYALLSAREDWVGSREHRDRSMADNVDWILDYEGADQIVIWAHDGHIRNGRVESSMPEPAATMGWYLAERYGADYYALGLEFGTGSFQAYPNPDRADENSLQEWSFENPREESVPAVFQGVDHSVFLLDMDYATGNDRLREWLKHEREILSIGALFYEDEIERHYNHSLLPKEFDGLLYVEESSPSRPLS